MSYSTVFLEKRSGLLKGEGFNSFVKCTDVMVKAHSNWFCGCRCSNDLKMHLEEGILSKLPGGYQSILKQTIISEETDMGTEIVLPVT